MANVKTEGMNLLASDVSGQRSAAIKNVAGDVSVGELVRGVLAKMKLPQNDSGGNPLAYHALLEREGRHLQDSELVGEALKPNDRIVLQPNIDAG